MQREDDDYISSSFLRCHQVLIDHPILPDTIKDMDNEETNSCNWYYLSLQIIMGSCPR